MRTDAKTEVGFYGWTANNRRKHAVSDRHRNRTTAVAQTRTDLQRMIGTTPMNWRFGGHKEPVVDSPKAEPPAVRLVGLVAAHCTAHFSDRFALPNAVGLCEDRFALAWPMGLPYCLPTTCISARADLVLKFRGPSRIPRNIATDDPAAHASPPRGSFARRCILPSSLIAASSSCVVQA